MSTDPRIYDLLRLLYRGGKFSHYWTPDGPEHTEPDGRQWREKISYWFDVDNIPKVPASWNGLNIYFAVHPNSLRRGQNERIRIEDIAAVNCLWREYDDLDDDKKAHIVAALIGSQPAPAAIVDSGGGLHVYWLLDTPLMLVDDATRSRAIDLQRAWVKLDPGADQTVHDLARVLRVPGTVNYKPEYAPNFPTITILHWNLSALHSLATFEALVQPTIDSWQQIRAQAAAAQPVNVDDDALLDVLFKSRHGMDYDRLWHGDLSVCDGDHSRCDQMLCNGLAWVTGRDAARIDRLFRQSALYRQKWENRSYRERTIDNAITTCQSVYTPSVVDPEAVAAAQAAVGPQPGSNGNSNGNGNGTGIPINGTGKTGGNSGVSGGAGRVRPKSAKKRSTGLNYLDLGLEYMKRYPGTMYSRGSWHRYNAGVWATVHDLTIHNEMWALLEEYSDRIRPTLSGLHVMSSFVQARTYVPEERLDADDALINLRNGTYSLELQSLLTHDPARYLTTQLPFDYDPAAVSPHWELYRQTTFVDSAGVFDPELADFIEEAIGYSLTTDIRHHVMFWLKGEGANGKGVLFHVLEALAGDAAIPFNVDLLHREQYQLADLAGKRIALCPEAKSDTVVEDALVKALVAGDSLRVRQIRREPFTLRPTVKLWWAMNKLPTVTDTSTGFWRRVVLVPFNADFEGRDRAKRIDDLKDRLILELPGIFNAAMRGLSRLTARGGFTRVKQIDELTAAYRRESNTIATFVDDECEVGAGYSAGAASLYARYKSWCEDNGFKAFNTRNFKAELERLGHRQKRVGTTRAFDGLRIRF